MIMMMKLDVELKIVTAVGGIVPTGGHSHHLLHLLLLTAVRQVGQEATLRLLPGAGRAVGQHQPLPLLDEGVGQITHLFT